MRPHPALRPTHYASLLAAVLLLTGPARAADEPARSTAASATAPATARPAVSAFFQRLAVSQAQLSPDGRRVAFRIGHPDGYRLGVLDLTTMMPSVAASFKDGSVRRFQWVNDRRLVFDMEVELTGPNRAEVGAGLYAVNADGEGFRQLVETVPTFVKSGDDDRLLPWNNYLLRHTGPQRGDDVYVVSPEELHDKGADYIRLRRVDTVKGRVSEVDAPLHAFEWLVDAEGELRVVMTEQADKRALHLRGPDGQWKKLAENERFLAQALEPSFIGPDGTLYVEAAGPSGHAALYTLDPLTGQHSVKPVAASKDFDIDAQPVVHQQRLVGLRYTIDAEITQWLDADLKALQAHIDQLLPATANRLTPPLRGDSPWLLVQAQSDVSAGSTYVYHRGTRKLAKIGDAMARIEPRLLGQMDFHKVKARDGREVPVYLTLPASGPKTGLPLVVLVHGGPWVRGHRWQWDAEVQLLASRGYAVLQPEFRGSTGYGAEHAQAGWKQWGQAMQDDVTDATRWAIDRGVADSKRICIAGASYGGYATLMGLVREPALYRCGVAWVAVSDIDLLYSSTWGDLPDAYKQFGMPTLVGDRVADAAMLKANSPIHRAAEIKQPLLLAYGAWDTRVPVVHGERLRDALAPHNQRVEWLVYRNEGHGWAHTDNQVDFWTKVEAFLARELAPR